MWGQRRGLRAHNALPCLWFHTHTNFFSASSITPESYNPSIGQRKSLPGPHGQTGIGEGQSTDRTCFSVALNIQEIRPCP